MARPCLPVVELGTRLVVIPCLKAVICKYNWFFVCPRIKLSKVGNGGLGCGFVFSGFRTFICEVNKS